MNKADQVIKTMANCPYEAIDSKQRWGYLRVDTNMYVQEVIIRKRYVYF